VEQIKTAVGILWKPDRQARWKFVNAECVDKVGEGSVERYVESRVRETFTPRIEDEALRQKDGSDRLDFVDTRLVSMP